MGPTNPPCLSADRIASGRPWLQRQAQISRPRQETRCCSGIGRPNSAIARPFVVGGVAVSFAEEEGWWGLSVRESLSHQLVFPVRGWRVSGRNRSVRKGCLILSPALDQWLRHWLDRAGETSLPASRRLHDGDISGSLSGSAHSINLLAHLPVSIKGFRAAAAGWCVACSGQLADGAAGQADGRRGIFSVVEHAIRTRLAACLVLQPLGARCCHKPLLHAEQSYAKEQQQKKFR